MKTTLLLLIFLTTSLSGLTTEKIKKAYYKSYNYEKMGNYKDAIKALAIPYKTYPNGYTLNLRLGHLYTADKKYTNAIAHYEKAIKTSPSSIEAKLGLMTIKIAQEKYTDAESLGYQIINTDYYNYYGNLKLSYTLRIQNKLDLAEKVLLKMLTLYPIDLYYLAEYGTLKMAQKDYSHAKSIFEDIKILDPENITANYYLQLIEKTNETKK